MTKLTADQIQFIKEIEFCGSALAGWVRAQFRKGTPLLEVKAAIRGAMNACGREG